MSLEQATSELAAHRAALQGAVRDAARRQQRERAAPVRRRAGRQPRADLLHAARRRQLRAADRLRQRRVALSRPADRRGTRRSPSASRSARRARRSSASSSIESLVFSIVAGALGVLLALWALSAIQSLVAAQLPPNTDADAELARARCSPAASRCSPRCWSGSRRRCRRRARSWSTCSRTARAARPASAAAASAPTLIVGEVALSVVLLVGSSLLLISFLKLQRTPPGFDAEGRRGGVRRRAARAATRRRAQQAEFFEQVIERLRAQPAGDATPRRRSACRCRASTRARRTASAAGRFCRCRSGRSPASAIVSDDYFTLMRIPLVDGPRVHRRRSRGRARRLHHQRVVREAAVPRRIGARQGAAARPRRRDTRRDRRRDSRRQDQRAQRAGARRDLLPDAPARPARHERRRAHRRAIRRRCRRSIRAAVAAVDKDQPISFFATLETNIAQQPRRAAHRRVADGDLRRPGARAVGGRAVFGARLRRVAADVGDRHPHGARRAAGAGDRPGHAQRAAAGRDRPGASAWRRPPAPRG